MHRGIKMAENQQQPEVHPWDTIGTPDFDQDKFNQWVYSQGAPPPPKEEPGFTGALKTSLASQAGGIGAIGRYAGIPGGENLEKWGSEYGAKNYAPGVDFGSLSEIAARPWEATKEAAGTALGYAAPAVLAGPVGVGARVLGVAPRVAGAIGRGAAATGFGAPMAGNVLTEQQQRGINEP